MSLARTFSANMARIRKEKEMSQSLLSETAGFSLSHIGSLERNQRDPSLHTVEVIARSLGVDPLAMLTNRETTP